MSDLMLISPGEQKLPVRFDSFFEAVGWGLAKIAVSGDIEAFYFFLRVALVPGNCAKAEKWK